MDRDYLAEALEEEGLNRAAADRVRARLREHGLHVMESPYAYQRRMREQNAERRAASRAAAKAASVPYRGAIRQCQASVPAERVGFHRCGKRPTYVIRVDEAPRSKADGRMAVCTAHLTPNYGRYHGHWSYEKDADEAVEEEYQP